MGILCTKNVTVSCLLVTGHLFDAVVVTSFGKKDAPSSLSVNVFSTKVLIGHTIIIIMSPSGDRTTILRGYLSQTKV